VLLGIPLPPALATVAGRWTSQLPPRPWTVTGPGPRGVPASGAPSCRSSRDRPSWPLPRLQSARDIAGTFARPPGGSPSGRIPTRSASRGLARLSPLRRVTTGASTPGAPSQATMPPRVEDSNPRHPVPSSWSVTTSTAFSAPGSAGLLRPASDLGVRRVSGRRVPRPPKRSVGTRAVFPATRSNTLQRVPLASSRTASLRPLPPCRCRVPEHPRPRGPGSRRARRRRGGPDSTESVLWFTKVNLHIVSVRWWAGCDPRSPPSSARRSPAVSGSPLPETPSCGSAPGAAGFEALLH
jgi:hypothetical protein